MDGPRHAGDRRARLLASGACQAESDGAVENLVCSRLLVVGMLGEQLRARVGGMLELRAPRSSLGAPLRAPGLEQLAQQRRDVSLHLDHLARLLKLGLGGARRAGAAGRSRRRAGQPCGARADAAAPAARRCRGRDATPSTATSTTPPCAAAHRSHPAACTRQPRAGSQACTAPRTVDGAVQA